MEENNLDIERELDLADKIAEENEIRYSIEEVLARVKEKLSIE